MASNPLLYIPMIKKYFHNISGASAIEYGMIAAALAIAAAVFAFGDDMSDVFTSMNSPVGAATDSAESITDAVD